MRMIEIASEQDRLAVATILLKNGYTVRQSRFKKPSLKTTTYVLLYAKDEIPLIREDEKE